MSERRLTDNSPATPKILRQFAALWLVFFGALAAWHARRGSGWLALVFGAIAIGAGAPGLVNPRRLRPLFLLLMVVTEPLGQAFSRVLLAVLFYGLFVPIGLAFRLAGRDALRLRYRAGRETYWTRKRTVTDLRSYLRQG